MPAPGGRGDGRQAEEGRRVVVMHGGDTCHVRGFAHAARLHTYAQVLPKRATSELLQPHAQAGYLPTYSPAFGLPSMLTTYTGRMHAATLTRQRLEALERDPAEHKDLEDLQQH